MKEFKKVYLISDLHGYYDGLEKVSSHVTVNTPLYVLGDLFDHKYGDENKIIDKIIELAAKNSLYYVIGNHDVTIDLAFNRKYDDNYTLTELTKEKNFENRFKIFQTMFSNQFFTKFEAIRSELFNQQLSVETRLNNYYLRMEELCNERQYVDRYMRIQALFNIALKSDEIQIGNKKILLTHSGVIEDPKSRLTAKAEYQLDEAYDFGVMGHLIIPKVELMIAEEGDMIDYATNFTKEYNIEDLTITGDTMYNSHAKQILIDNGSHNNLVAIEAI